MKKVRSRKCWWGVCMLLGFWAVHMADAAQGLVWTNPSPEVAVFAGRASNVVNALGLKDPEKINVVGQTIFTNLVWLSRWHDTNAAVGVGSQSSAQGASGGMRTPPVDSPELLWWRMNLEALLSVHLTPQEIDTVKEVLTQWRMSTTFRAYCELNPWLTEDQKSAILELLKQARDEALVAGSAEAKNAVFRKYKGRVNNLLARWKAAATNNASSQPASKPQ